MFQIFKELFYKPYNDLTNLISVDMGGIINGVDPDSSTKMLSLLNEYKFKIDRHAFSELINYCLQRYDSKDTFEVFNILINDYGKNFKLNLAPFSIVFFTIHIFHDKSSWKFLEVLVDKYFDEIVEFQKMDKTSFELLDLNLENDSFDRHKRLWELFNHFKFNRYFKKSYGERILTSFLKNNKIHPYSLIEDF